MKQILVLLFTLFLWNTASACEIDEELEVYVTCYQMLFLHFENEDIQDRIDALQRIRVAPLENNWLGKTTCIGDKAIEIVISPKAMKNRHTIMIVLFHELTHALFGIDGHYCYDCESIFAEKIPIQRILNAFHGRLSDEEVEYLFKVTQKMRKY